MGLKPVKVSQLNSYIKRILQTDPILGNVSVIGEVSNLKFHSSGHVYFSLKDETSKVNCFMAADTSSKLSVNLDEGMEITASGYIYLYERGGNYSLNIRSIEVSGQGDLAVAFMKLKEKLEKEGLFDKKYKKELPVFPHKIAVVTSATGAAVRDITKIIKQKNNYVDILIYPVLVQGPDAAYEISAAIEDINSNYSDVDVIIAGRGGGSMEELWAFNEEVVARSIFNSVIPIISAVGHETDYTIIDFVSDLRAPTPSAAAELAVYDLRYILDMISGYKKALDIAIFDRLEDKKFKLLSIETKLKYLNPITQVKVKKQKIIEYRYRLNKNIQSIFLRDKHRLAVLAQKLHGASPLTKLESGYAYIEDNDKKAIKSIDMIDVGESFNIYLKDGMLKANVLDKKRSNNVNWINSWKCNGTIRGTNN